MWSWEGISAESIIFASDDISDLTDEELEQEVRTSPLISKESAVTIKCLDSGYTFVNILTNNKSFKPTCGIQAVKS